MSKACSAIRPDLFEEDDHIVGNLLSERQWEAVKPALMLGNTLFAQMNGIDVTKLRDWVVKCLTLGA